MSDVEKTAQWQQATEKASPDAEVSSTGPNDHPASTSAPTSTPPPSSFHPNRRHVRGKLSQINARVEGLRAIEARGIARVMPEEKMSAASLRDYLHMFALWFSINLQATNIVIGLLGITLFSLGWVDCVCIIIFAHVLSAAFIAYMSTFGPESGNRAMIVARYFMGYWPAKLTTIFNIVMQVGWATIGSIVAGQMFSAVNGKGLTIAVGCVIAALCIGLIATFGITFVNRVERFAFIPQLVAILVLIGSAGRNFDVDYKSTGDTATITANRVSFFSLMFASVIGFSAVSGDLYVYYPVNTPKLITFGTTYMGTYIALIFSNIIGVAIGTGIPNVPAWAEAYEVSSGALLYATYDGLGGFGGLMVVLLALGSVTNNAPSIYAAALDFQVLGRYPRMVPRWCWGIILTIVILVLSVAGRNVLYKVFNNFLPITAYWTCPWVIIAGLEHLLFHKLPGKPFNWDIWQSQKDLPLGIAAMASFALSWVGAVIGMNQTWFIGPVAQPIGNGYGADIGTWLAIGIVLLSFPPLRYLELKKVGR